MNQTYLGVFALFVLSLVINTAGSAESIPEPTYKALGPGAISCGQWLIDKTNGTLRYGDRMWVLGYLTRVNANAAAVLFNEHKMVTHQDLADGVQDEALVAWIDKYCAAHASETVATAAAELYAALANREAEASGAVAKSMLRYLENLGK